MLPFITRKLDFIIKSAILVIKSVKKLLVNASPGKKLGRIRPAKSTKINEYFCQSVNSLLFHVSYAFLIKEGITTNGFSALILSPIFLHPQPHNRTSALHNPKILQ